MLERTMEVKYPNLGVEVNQKGKEERCDNEREKKASIPEGGLEMENHFHREASFYGNTKRGGGKKQRKKGKKSATLKGKAFFNIIGTPYRRSYCIIK